MKFTQTISVRCGDADALTALLAEWDQLQANSELMGYIGTRLLADRDDPLSSPLVRRGRARMGALRRAVPHRGHRQPANRLSGLSLSPRASRPTAGAHVR